MNNFTFHNPTELLFGKGMIKQLGDRVKKFGNSVLLVTGGGSVKRIGLYDEVIGILNENGIDIHEVSGVKPNPRIDKVREGVKICRENNVDLVLGVGGGSTIDTAKSIAAGVKFDGDPWEMFTMDGEPDKAIPVGAVLTLAATGTEMNGNAVISNLETNEKLAIHTPAVNPRFSILDPVYTCTVPEEHTVYGIVDIAAHVYEQYFSHTPGTPVQDRWAESILITLREESKKVLDNPEDYEARANIMLCGTMALNGLIAMGKETDWASHAIEHELSAFYDIPHGGGLAIIFPNWMKYVMDEGLDKFVQYAVRVFGVSTDDKTDREVALEGIEKTRQWFNEMGAPSRLADYNIGEEKLEIMAESAVSNKELGGYKKLTKDDVYQILKMSL
ncbi:iron-containing alcohol dehydrogenase [Halothermothrix orenii]|uniref:Iron-containing alcohol dehydrogenase n=1 Tax=Halothermothrix orenii (strain H 168 / OCM 544 / DSM 9562) TaxID=373903 RepID=B8CZS4_HALOH|nr:iron-containing alcohol dehydrogenase [Halothermothrix orenii]ACL70776.1 iron-containing alcohol dehydrogenase [Halothermothrix orenii H 168]